MRGLLRRPEETTESVNERLEALVAEHVAAIEERLNKTLTEALSNLDERIDRVAEAKAKALLPAWIGRLPILPTRTDAARRFSDGVGVVGLRVEADGDPLDDSTHLRFLKVDTSGKEVEVAFPSGHLHEWTLGLLRDLKNDPFLKQWDESLRTIGPLGTPAGAAEFKRFVARELLARQAEAEMARRGRSLDI